MLRIHCPLPQFTKEKTTSLSFLPPSCIIALSTRFLLIVRHWLLQFGGKETAFSARLLCELGAAMTDCPTLQVTFRADCKLFPLHTCRHLNQPLFPESKVVLLVKHSSALPLTYRKLVSTLFGNWGTGTTIARGCKCPGCFILKFNSDQLLTLMENSLQLERHVHGFQLIWAKDRYSVTAKHTASILGSYHFQDQCTVQFRRNRMRGCRLKPSYRLCFPWGVYQFIPMIFYTKIFPYQRQFGFLHWSTGSVQSYR